MEFVVDPPQDSAENLRDKVREMQIKAHSIVSNYQTGIIDTWMSEEVGIEIKDPFKGKKIKMIRSGEMFAKTTIHFWYPDGEINSIV